MALGDPQVNIPQAIFFIFFSLDRIASRVIQRAEGPLAGREKLKKIAPFPSPYTALYNMAMGDPPRLTKP